MNTHTNETLIMDFKTLITNTINYQKQAEKESINIFTKSDMKILENLKKDKNTIICRPDKGRGVIILNREDYVSKMDNILNDYATFQKCITLIH